MSTHFIRHSVKIGEHSHFIMYQKTSEYLAFKIGQAIAYIVFVLPFKILFFLSSTFLKLLLNGIFTFVYWIKGKRDSSTIVENERKLENIYSKVDKIAAIWGYICNTVIIVFLIYSLSIYMKQREQAKERQYAAEQMQSNGNDSIVTEEGSVNDSLEKPFHIWCGKFWNQEEADKGVQMLSKKGIKAYVEIIENPINEGGGFTFVLSVGEYSSKKKAKKMLKKVQKYFPDAIVANVEG